MTFVNAQGPLPSMDMSVPDIFLQTTPVGPMPMPFISIGMRAAYTPGNMRLLVMGAPVHALMDKTELTQSGPGPGAVSGTVCGPSRSAKGSSKLIVGTAPATRALLDPTMQNGMAPNSTGNTIAPSQIKLLNPSA